MLKPCFSKFCYVFLYLGGSGVLSFVQKKSMTEEGKMFRKLFAKMECLRLVSYTHLTLPTKRIV